MRERISLIVLILCIVLGIAAGIIVGRLLLENADFITVQDYLHCYVGLPFIGCILGMLVGASLSDLIEG